MRTQFSKLALTVVFGLVLSCSDLPDINEEGAASSSSGKGTSNLSSSGTVLSSSSLNTSGSSAGTQSSSSAVLSSSSVVQSSSGGSPVTKNNIWNGTADTTWFTSDKDRTTPYHISTAEQLAGLALLVNGNGTANGRYDMGGKIIQLDADIMLNDT